MIDPFVWGPWAGMGGRRVPPPKARRIVRFLPPRSWVTVLVIAAVVIGGCLALAGVKAPQL